MSDFNYKQEYICGQSKNIENGTGIIFRKNKNGFLKIASDKKPVGFSDSCIRTDYGFADDNVWGESDSRSKMYAIRLIKEHSYTKADLILHPDDLADKMKDDDNMGIVSGGSKQVGEVDHTDVDGAWKLITGLDRLSLSLKMSEKLIGRSCKFLSGELPGQGMLDFSFNDLETFTAKVRKFTAMPHVPEDNPALGGQLHTEENPVFWSQSWSRQRIRDVEGVGKVRCIVEDPSAAPRNSGRWGSAGTSAGQWRLWLAPYGTRWKKTVERTLSANGATLGKYTWDKEVVTWKMLVQPGHEDAYIPPVEYYEYERGSWRNAYMFSEMTKTTLKGSHPEHEDYRGDGASADFISTDVWPSFKAHSWSRGALKAMVTRKLSIALAAKRLYYLSLYEEKGSVLTTDWLTKYDAERTTLSNYGYTDAMIVEDIEKYHTRHDTSHASRYRYQFYFAYIMFRWKFDSIFEKLGLSAGAIDKRQQQFLDAKSGQTQAGFNRVGWRKFTSFDASPQGNDTILLESFEMWEDGGPTCIEDWMRGVGEYLREGFHFGEADEETIDILIERQFDYMWKDVWPQADGDSMGNDDIGFNGWQRFHERVIREASKIGIPDDDDDERHGGGFDDDHADFCDDNLSECSTKRIFSWLGANCPKPYTDAWHTGADKYKWPCGY